MSVVGQAAVLVAFPVAASALGSIVAVLRRPGPRLVSAIQHFAAGVVVAALAGEVLPGLRQEGNLAWAVTGFTAGVAVVLALAAYGRRRDAAAAPSADSAAGSAGLLPLGLLVAVGIDLLIDGMLVGLGVTLGSTQGLILTIALTIEILFLGLSLAAELTDTGLSKARAALVCTGLGLATAVGAIGGAASLAGASKPVLAAVLAFGAAALLYLAVEELLVEAHEQVETTLSAAMFFAGFLTIYLLGELGG
ncbi:ZIP family metal transporter [Dermacoccus nishinomiyaensis]|uniref:ZIP family metal transporter n=1 Tax=Dermacoccus nishinomiyaensis TaxID=1274 RepID=UPI0013F450C3|nr:ZIP family metal transporter [Dermacoccus nishinomiyaensis]NHC33014.1 ZIP family metal transporter [Dermacoccus nishinomiyaensis]